MTLEEYEQFCRDKTIQALLILRTTGATPDELKFFISVEDKAFEDILAILRDKEYVNSYDGGGLYWITDKGRIHVLQSAKNVKFQPDGSIYNPPVLPVDMPKQTHAAYWKHGISKLQILAQHLKKDGFIENENSFIGALIEPGAIKCNWLKNHTSLLYLLCGALTKKPKSVPAFIREVAFNRFMVAGVQKSSDEIRTTSGKVKPHLQKEEIDLRGEYLTLFLILEKSLL